MAKPLISGMDRTVAGFGTTSTTYNSTTTTYSRATQIYAGAVGWSDYPKTKVFVDSYKPKLNSVSIL